MITQYSPNRGAVKHVVIGCLAVVVVIVVALVGGGYYLFRQVAPAAFDVAAKADPAADATMDEVLPHQAGQFERVAIGDVDPRAGDWATTGTKAIYRASGSDETATVIAVPTSIWNEVHIGAGRGQERLHSEGSNVGTAARIPFGASKGEIASWSKANWSYMVQTTNTSALEFAKEFEPAAGTE